MGCAETKSVSKHPGTSVVTDDTYLDEYNDNVSDDRFVNSGSKTQENGRIINNNDEMSNKYPGFNKHNAVITNGYANKQTLGNSNPRNQHFTVISSNKPGYGKRNVKATSNTQNITNLVDIEDYEDFNSNEKQVTNTIVLNGTIHKKDEKPESKTTTKDSIKSPDSIPDTSPKVLTPINRVKREPKSIPSTTSNITGVVDIEDYDYSDNQTISTVNKSSDDGRGQNFKTINSVAKGYDDEPVRNNNNNNNNSKEYNSQAKVQNNSITVISSNRSVYGKQNTKKTASSHTDSITNIVDLEEYD